ncbi:MAG TPA: NAD(P)-binding domain-containing protein [Methylomirabilota bacterium]|jgi:4-hydroxybutyrate dehydrogenase/sulfolactaldehyde 3-reductase
MRVGFIGLGLMGGPMAGNVLKKGFPLTVCDVVPERVDALVARGATAAATPRDVAAASDVVLTILPASADVEAVVLGPAGVAEGARPGLALVEMSTIDPHVTKRVAAALAARGLRMLDAPVGRPSTFAESAELAFMVGGDAALLEEVRPVLLAMGNTIFHCGGTGMGATMKAVNNLLSITTLAVTGEALVLGAKAGLTADVMLEVFRRTAASNAHLHMTYPDKALKGDFSPMFMVDLAHKDLSVGLALGAAQQVPLPLGALAREMFTTARARGRGRLDWTAVITVLEDEAGVKVRRA